MIELAPKKKRNVRGKSGEKARGSFCTPKPVADAVGPFDLDPFSNPHSHIVSPVACMLERGDDGLAGPRKGEYFLGPTAGILAPGEDVRWPTACGRRRAEADTRTWIQPNYSFVMQALLHYEHTRFCALLRFDPRTEWFKWLLARTEAIRVFWDIQFDPPPGVKVDGKGTNSFPHALFYRSAADVTDAVRGITFGWKKQRKD